MSARLYPFGRNGGQRVDTARRFQPTTTAELLEIPPPLVHIRTLAARRLACCSGRCRQGRDCPHRQGPARPSLVIVALLWAVVGFLMLVGLIR